MATDIALTDLTNSTIISNGVSDGTGVFDKLMNSVNLYLTDQEDSGKIKGTDYANVLLGSIQAVLQQSIQFTLQEKLTEAQIDGILQDNLLKVEQVLIAKQELLLKAKQLEIEEYRLLNIVPAELAQLQKQTDVAERGMIEQELTGTEQRLEIKASVDLKEDELAINTLKKSQLTAQTAEIVDATARANTQLTDTLATSVKQRILLDEEKETSDLNQIILVTEETIKEAQLLDIVKGTDVKERQTGMQENESTKQMLILDEQKLKLQKETDILYVDQIIKDKQATKLGLDKVTLTVNTTPEDVYTPKYEEA